LRGLGGVMWRCKFCDGRGSGLDSVAIGRNRYQRARNPYGRECDCAPCRDACERKTNAAAMHGPAVGSDGLPRWLRECRRSMDYVRGVGGLLFEQGRENYADGARQLGSPLLRRLSVERAH
jgi:hypothetical protein